jgi:hypothetical protein
VRIFKTKWFARFARKEHISDKMLMNASPVELDVYRKLAHIYLGFSSEDLAKAQQYREIGEVHHEKEISN